MDVHEVMTKRVTTCREADTLMSAARRMHEAGVSCVPVLADDGSRRVVGVLTHRGVCEAAVAKGEAVDSLPVRVAMAQPARCCWRDDSIESAEAIMRAYRVHRLPVVAPCGDLVGLVSLADIARVAVHEHEGSGASTPGVLETLAATSRTPAGTEPDKKWGVTLQIVA